jgi:hypothetical protein
MIVQHLCAVVKGSSRIFRGEGEESVTRDVLARAVTGFPNLSTAERQAIVMTFVDGMYVLIGDGETTGVVGILFRWRSGWTNMLISFRGPAADARFGTNPTCWGDDNADECADFLPLRSRTGAGCPC